MVRWKTIIRLLLKQRLPPASRDQNLVPLLSYSRSPFILPTLPTLPCSVQQLVMAEILEEMKQVERTADISSEEEGSEVENR